MKSTCPHCGFTEEPVAHGNRGCGGVLYKDGGRWFCQECGVSVLSFAMHRCDSCGGANRSEDVIQEVEWRADQRQGAVSDLARCVACGGRVSARADACPHCGEPRFRPRTLYETPGPLPLCGVCRGSGKVQGWFSTSTCTNCAGQGLVKK